MRLHPTPAIARAALIALAAAYIAGCGDSDDAAPDEQQPEPSCEMVLPEPGEFFDKLSDYCFFRGDMAAQNPNEGLVPYDVNAVLYSDHSTKLRFIALPEGKKIDFREVGKWDFPRGTTIVKTFYFPADPADPEGGRRLVETRLMVMGDTDWHTHTYRWDDEQIEATSYLVGATIDVAWVDDAGETVEGKYRIPSKSDCRNCHVEDNKTMELGPHTRQLNRLNDFGDGPTNQLDHYRELGMFSEQIPEAKDLPVFIDPKDESQPLNERARTYLEANCAHCHNPGGAARNSGLYLNYDEASPTRYGVCKPPVAAGHIAEGLRYDIVPGKPEESIMIHRINSMKPGVKMPELPLTTIDHFGVELLSEWIRQMDGSCD